MNYLKKSFVLITIYYKNGNYDELKEIDIKNRTGYYVGNIMEVSDIYSENILLDEKFCKKI